MAMIPMTPQLARVVLADSLADSPAAVDIPLLNSSNKEAVVGSQAVGSNSTLVEAGASRYFYETCKRRLYFHWPMLRILLYYIMTTTRILPNGRFSCNSIRYPANNHIQILV